MSIISWHENLPSEDIPPRWMWHLSDELEAHFEMVKSRRKHGDTDDDEDWAPGHTIKNEYAKGRGKVTRV